MAKRDDIQSILIIGAGPIVIGQACEFDYSGAQACKALKEEGYRVILVNSNPATIMTDPNLADATYIEPIQWDIVEKIIAKENPDAILPTMGGQTALNCALDLDRHGILEKYNVELIGASKQAIDKAEDRQLFKEANIVIPGGVNSPVRAFKAVGGTPIFVKKAKGAYLYDEDGNRLIDYINSWGPMILGHAYKPVVDAVVEKAKKGRNSSNCRSQKRRT